MNVPRKLDNAKISLVSFIAIHIVALIWNNKISSISIFVGVICLAPSLQYTIRCKRENSLKKYVVRWLVGSIVCLLVQTDLHSRSIEPFTLIYTKSFVVDTEKSARQAFKKPVAKSKLFETKQKKNTTHKQWR